MTATRIKTEILIIGSGIAGCTAALGLADKGHEVTLLSSGMTLDNGNTALAQGGIIYKGTDDSPEQLARDIFTAGWNYNYESAVRHLCEEGPKAVEEILFERVHVPFDHTEHGELYRTKEGGHGLHRILTCADYTGRAIQDCLTKAVESHPNIRILRSCTAIDLLATRHHSTQIEFRYQLVNQCVGAYVFNAETDEPNTILADYTVLCTGGLGQIFLHTTNSSSSIGSGMAMAYRAGVTLMNLEYIQFHPTALFHRSDRKFLISEAVRGEGARLFNIKGERFMARYDERMELAPRDIVARAIVDEMLKTGEDCVFLDAANYVDKNLRKRFPTIYKKCKENGVDITREPIPVVPAAHYFCGGVLVDNRGRTTMDRLYAAGEIACTGLHGANRLASSSLLEGLLWGMGTAKDIHQCYDEGQRLDQRLQDSIPDWVTSGKTEMEDPALINQDWATIRSTMWNYMGIVRTTSRLERAFEDLRNLNKRLHSFYKSIRICKESVDLFHGCQTAYIVTTAALRNKNSRGCHFRKD
ncbi:MAG: L-aspartate oxidase [Desulfovibrionales bacterium]|nr:L-aspartate oxidase [Desulfovibrionales bacterium]